MKYKCNDCGWVFDEPYLYEEPDVGYAALWCPECHSDDIIEVAECKYCEELTPIHDLTIDGYCPDCVRRAAKKYDMFSAFTRSSSASNQSAIKKQIKEDK